MFGNQDMTFCMDECENTECERHKNNIKEPTCPHSMSFFKETEYCSLFSDSAAPTAPSACSNMEPMNFIFGNSRGNYPIQRGEADDVFAEFLENLDCDYHGHPRKSSPIFSYQNPQGIVETDTFSLFPYYWGDDEELANRPNFVYKPENIEIQWYKYPLRDSYSNVPLNAEKIREILEICISSLKTERKEE